MGDTGVLDVLGALSGKPTTGGPVGMLAMGGFNGPGARDRYGRQAL
jgi:hypothetical protein